MKISVQLLVDGPITELDDSQLDRRDSVVENEREHTEVVEYFLRGDYSRAVHRSVHVTLKQGIGLEAVLGTLGN